MIGNQDFVVRIKILCVRHEKADILRIAEKCANWIRDFVFVQFRRRKLIEQRLKYMKIIPVDNCNIDGKIR